MNVIYRDRPQWHGDHYETESIPYCAACEKIIEDIAHDFCGWCGSPLSDPTPLTLEELREMDGQTVWAGNDSEPDGFEWFIVECQSQYKPFILLNCNNNLMWQFMKGPAHPNGWSAYTPKPKDGGK